MLTRLKEMLSNGQPQTQSNNPIILIAEDDPDQMSLLVDLVLSEMKKLINDADTDKRQRQKLNDIEIISVSNLESLNTEVSNRKEAVLAILDCNMPSKAGGSANDQFVKTNHIITGQHKSVDIVAEQLPETPITMISSLNRFHRTIIQYYENQASLSLNFIQKKEAAKIRSNIGYYLRQHIYI